MCVSVISAPPLGGGAEATATTIGKHLEHKARLRHWAEPLRLPPGRISLHVVEAADAAATLLELTRVNQLMQKFPGFAIVAPQFKVAPETVPEEVPAESPAQLPVAV